MTFIFIGLDMEIKLNYVKRPLLNSIMKNKRIKEDAGPRFLANIWSANFCHLPRPFYLRMGSHLELVEPCKPTMSHSNPTTNPRNIWCT